MKTVFYFGEKIKGYDIRMLNEREVRASAGILFLFAIISFLNSWLVGNFYFTKIFVVAFLIDFSIRVFVNPKFSPTLIIGRFFVRKQEPEYVGAPQKRFAWIIGFLLGLTMFFTVVVYNVIGPINLFVCLACMILLFFEASFGICIGCKVYNLFNRNKASLCPGGSCLTSKKEGILKITFPQIIITTLFIGMVFFTGTLIKKSSVVAKESGDDYFKESCVVPEWAKKIGHEKMYKLHHGCM